MLTTILTRLHKFHLITIKPILKGARLGTLTALRETPRHT